MDSDRIFRVLYDGTWEEGPPHMFPVRKFVHSKWVDVGLSDFPTFKYIGFKSVESSIVWNGDKASIKDLGEFARNSIPLDTVGQNINIYWLWGKQRYKFVKDIDIIFFWEHAPVDDVSFTEIIVEFEDIVPLAVDASTFNLVPDITTDSVEKPIDIMEIPTPRRKETPNKKKMKTPKKKTPKKTRQDSHGGDQAESNKKQRSKLSVKRKISVEKEVGGESNNIGVEEESNIVESNIEDDVDFNNEDDIQLNFDDYENFARTEKANCKYKGAEDEPNNLCDDGVEDLNVGNEADSNYKGAEDDDNLSWEDDDFTAGKRNSPQKDIEEEEPVIVKLFGKTFNLDQIDAEDEEYLSEASSEEEIEPEQDHEEPVINKKAKSSDGAEGSSNTNLVGDDSGGEDEELIKRTEMLNEDEIENSHGEKGLRPLIGIDGCFLKGKYGGACLTMIALDGNNDMFPLGFYIGLSEDTENWK
ncbi:hypothetical protein FRX31_035047, partial [Thalictrum thalictroides]